MVGRLIALMIILLVLVFGGENKVPDSAKLIDTYPSGNGQYSLEAYEISPALSATDIACFCIDQDGNRKRVYYGDHEDFADVLWVDEKTVTINGVTIDVTEKNHDVGNVTMDAPRLMWLLKRDFELDVDTYKVNRFVESESHVIYMEGSYTGDAAAFEKELKENDVINRMPINSFLKQKIMGDANDLAIFLADDSEEQGWYGLYSDYMHMPLDADEINSSIAEEDEIYDQDMFKSYTFFSYSETTGVMSVLVCPEGKE